jgi:hypothetical protein
MARKRVRTLAGGSVVFIARNLQGRPDFQAKVWAAKHPSAHSDWTLVYVRIPAIVISPSTPS